MKGKFNFLDLFCDACFSGSIVKKNYYENNKNGTLYCFYILSFKSFETSSLYDVVVEFRTLFCDADVAKSTADM
jgi:hypothetical protein